MASFQSKFQLRPAIRLAITVGFVCVSLFSIAMGLNFIPNPKKSDADLRIGIIRTVATSVSTFAENNRFSSLQTFLDRTLAIEPRLASIAIKRGKNEQLASGPHQELWVAGKETDFSSGQVAISVFCNGKDWGQLEMIFKTPQRFWWSSVVEFPNPLIAFLFGSVTLVTWFVLNKTFKYINPSRLVPDRVRSAFDTIGSGLAMVTPNGEIAHANRSFCRIVGRDSEQVVGSKIDEYHWTLENDVPRDFPWNRTRRYREVISGEIVQAKFNSGVAQKYMVNSTPVLGAASELRGLLVSFEDVTALEAKKAELAKIIQTVRQSRDEVQRQNEQLNFLANYDSLTRCMNRRSFYSEFEKLWNQKLEHPLSVLIMDIDFFKKINDNHGHSAGDEVLRTVGALLVSTLGSRGTVCRYGGEEFTVLLADLDFAACCGIAEELRLAVQEQPIAQINVSISIGISHRGLGAMDQQHLLDQADQALYAAKRNGRNQVVRYDRLQEYVSTESEVPQQPVSNEQSDSSPESEKFPDIEYSSVTGLLSALSFRSRETAEHSVRVADIAVDIGRGLLSNRELYQLEIAALLHDVGKIGVPDNILNKIGKLTEEEWQILKRYDEMGIAIIRSAFSSCSITQTIETYFSIKNNSCGGIRTTDSENSLSSEILYVCDAFDSMISGSTYRKGLSTGDALAEILKNTPKQFCPTVVNQLVEYVTSGRLENRRQTATEVPASSVANKVDNEESVEKGNSKNGELDKLIILADEVMTLCYQSNRENDQRLVGKKS